MWLPSVQNEIRSSFRLIVRKLELEFVWRVRTFFGLNLFFRYGMYVLIWKPRLAQVHSRWDIFLELYSLLFFLFVGIMLIFWWVSIPWLFILYKWVSWKRSSYVMHIAIHLGRKVMHSYFPNIPISACYRRYFLFSRDARGVIDNYFPRHYVSCCMVMKKKSYINCIVVTAWLDAVFHS